MLTVDRVRDEPTGQGLKRREALLSGCSISVGGDVLDCFVLQAMAQRENTELVRTVRMRCSRETED